MALCVLLDKFAVFKPVLRTRNVWMASTAGLKNVLMNLLVVKIPPAQELIEFAVAEPTIRCGNNPNRCPGSVCINKLCEL